MVYIINYLYILELVYFINCVDFEDEGGVVVMLSPLCTDLLHQIIITIFPLYQNNLHKKYEITNNR